VEKIIDEGETAVMDRGYQSNAHFDQWQTDEKHFVCRIRKNTTKTSSLATTQKVVCFCYIMC